MAVGAFLCVDFLDDNASLGLSYKFLCAAPAPTSDSASPGPAPPLAYFV